MSRHFLVSYYGVLNDGGNFIGSCALTISDGEKMTQKRLDSLMKEAMDKHGATKVIPIAVSELEVEEDGSDGTIPN